MRGRKVEGRMMRGKRRWNGEEGVREKELEGGGGVPRKRQEKMGWKGEMTRWNRVVRKMIHPYS